MVQTEHFEFFYDDKTEQLNFRRLNMNSFIPLFDSCTKELFDLCVYLQGQLNRYEDFELQYDVQELND